MVLSVSVVIPTRDRHDYLRQAVASVLDQSHAAAEIIVVDDGAGAANALSGMSSRITVLANDRRGPVAARNLGVGAAASDCIAFLDDDDWFSDASHLAQAVAGIASGADFCFANGTLVFMDGGANLPFSFAADAKSLESDNTILISAVTYRRSLHAKLGSFDPALPYYWDWDWYLRVARSGARLNHRAHPTVSIRVHRANMSGAETESLRRANLDALARKHGLPPLVLKNHLSLAGEAPR